MPTLDETRFRACRESSDTYCNSFQKLGREHTAEIAKGVIEASVGALQALEGEAAAYFFIQRLADHVAGTMIDGARK